MGTRSLVHFCDSDHRENIICTVYQQFDGMPTKEGVGGQIAKLLKEMNLVNGFQSEGKEANGMGCLAAQYISANKNGVGNLYVYPTNSHNVGEEYEYYITKKKVLIETCYKEKQKYTDSWKEFIDFIEKGE